jgi:oleate hydratase
VVPERAENFAFIGQFCELPEDTVFTVEYSVRSAQQALAGLCATGEVTRIYHGSLNPKVVTAALFSIASNGI